MKDLIAGGDQGLDDPQLSRIGSELFACEFYQFSEKPFGTNPDPKFVYLTPSYQKIFVSILTWVRQGEGLAVITGEAGTGKTFFIHALISRLEERIEPILVLNPAVAFRDLMKQILTVVRVPFQEDTETGFLHQFARFLDRMIAQDKTPLIILEEAQGLNDGILDGIGRLLNLRPERIRMIFVGQPSFGERIHYAAFRRLGQKIGNRQEIKPFTEEESLGYIDHRLRLVGSSSDIMTPEAISLICSYTQGISRLINHVCDNALWVGCNLNRKKIDVDIIREVIKNLEGPGIVPKRFPSIQLRRRWQHLSQSPTSLSRSEQRLKWPRMIPKNLRPIRVPRQIWEAPVRLATSVKTGSMAALFKFLTILKWLRVIPKTLLSVQVLGRIRKLPARFANSVIRSVAVLSKNVPRLEWPRIVPKTLPSLRAFGRVWELSVRSAISVKRGSAAFFSKMKKDLRDLRVVSKNVPSIRPLVRIRKPPIGFAIPFKKISMAVSLLAFLGGLFLLAYEYAGTASMKIEAIKAFIGKNLETRNSIRNPSVQEKVERISTKDEVPISYETTESTPPHIESSSPRQDSVIFKPAKRKQKSKGTVTDEIPKKEQLAPSPESGIEKDFFVEAPKPVRDTSTQPLTLTRVFAVEKGPYGCVWRIYIDAEDTDGDMNRISLEVDQANYGRYPTEWIAISPKHRRHLTGFVQWNTFSSKASNLPEGTQILVKITILDQAGNKSNQVTVPFTFESGVVIPRQLPAPFDKGKISRIGYVMVDLCYNNL